MIGADVTQNHVPLSHGGRDHIGPRFDAIGKWGETATYDLPSVPGFNGTLYVPTNRKESAKIADQDDALIGQTFAPRSDSRS